MKTYEVSVRREDRWWMVSVPEVGGMTQARRLDEVEQMAREYIAVSTDVPLSKVAVEVVGIEADSRDLLEAKTVVDALRRRAKDLEALVAELTREVAAALTGTGVPVRDVSTVLGVSHQRVSQLVQEAAGDTTVLARAHREFTHDLTINLTDGRTLRLVEAPAPKVTHPPRRRTQPKNRIPEPQRKPA